MKRQLLLILTCLVAINSYAQIVFEKGYYINNSDEKIECFIKNVDWRSNPIDFEYKLTENAQAITANIEAVKEFSIENDSKYIRADVEIDRSSEALDKLSSDRNPVYKEEQLFLKVLIEGKANLYFYKDQNLNRYFYNLENSEIEQLVFKSYRAEGSKIGTNNRFRQQLLNTLKCSSFSEKNFKNLEYRKNSLSKLFIRYNECSDSKFVNFEEDKKQYLFNLNVRVGLNSSSLSIINSTNSNSAADFDNELSLRLGIEAEVIMPFNKNKWAFIVEPTYQSYKSELSNGASVDYASIELPLGARHYLFINKDSKLFLNASLIFDFDFNSEVLPRFNRLDVSSQINYAFGLGYKYMDKYSLELRYITNREVLNDYLFWKSDYKTISVIFGYTLF